jgi:hypothetical protein
VSSREREREILLALRNCAALLREADKLLPRRPPSGSPEAVVKWRIEDLLIRIRRAQETWEPVPGNVPFPEEET